MMARSIQAQRRLWRQGYNDAFMGGWTEPRRDEAEYLRGYVAGGSQQASMAASIRSIPASAYEPYGAYEDEA